MENASKALIIVGGVLIGVMILSMFLYVFRAAAKTNQSYDEKQAQEQLETYNAKYEVYNRNNNTIIDLLTVINLAYDNNVSCDYDPQNSVEILIKISDSKYYKIPGDYNKKDVIDKNQVLSLIDEKSSSGTAISIYDLINKSFEELQINNTNTEIKSDTLIKSKLTTSGKTIYKYLFKLDKIDYHKENGKISYMKFQILKYKNWSNQTTNEDNLFTIYSDENGENGIDKFYTKTIN